jgi:peptidylprolyl isomerase
VDGVAFEDNYSSAPFAVQLGSGSVIDGWDQGLIGIKAGGRRQLDIPADLAYGDQAKSEIIRAGEALTFVIDAVAVTPAAG